MSGTGYPLAYAYAQSGHNDLSYPEYPGRVASIPQTQRVPSLPLPVGLPPLPLPIVPMSMQQPPILPPPSHARVPSIPQAMQMSSMNRVPSIPSIPTPHRPLTLQPTTSLSMVDPMVQPSWGYSAGWGGGYEPAAYGVSGGYMLPGYGYSVGPPMQLYQQSRTGSMAPMDMPGGPGVDGPPVMMDMGGGQMMPMMPPHAQMQQAHMQGGMMPLPPPRPGNPAGPSPPPAAASRGAAPGPTSASSGKALNVRVSPPPFDRNAAPSASYHAYPQFSGDPSFRKSSDGPSASSAAAASSATSSQGTLDAATFHHNIRLLNASTARLLCLPCEDHSAPVLFVHSYQYMQILKRRDQRRNDKRKRIKSKHKSRQAHAARRVRGSGGRFLTKEEKAMLGFNNRP